MFGFSGFSETPFSSPIIAVLANAAIVEADDTLLASATLQIGATESSVVQDDTLAAVAVLAIRAVASPVEQDDSLAAVTVIRNAVREAVCEIIEDGDTLAAHVVGSHVYQASFVARIPTAHRIQAATPRSRAIGASAKQRSAMQARAKQNRSYEVAIDRSPSPAITNIPPHRTYEIRI